MDARNKISAVMTTIQGFLKDKKKWRTIRAVHTHIKHCIIEKEQLEPFLEPFVHAYLYVTPVSGCIVRDEYVCLAECFDSALAKIQKILESPNAAEIKDAEDTFLQQASKAEQIAVGNITHVVEMKKGKVCVRRCCPLGSADYLPFHLHFIIEALEAIITHLENIQQSSLPSGGCPFQVIADVLKQKCSKYARKCFGGFKTSVEPKALKKILVSYDTLFIVTSTGVALQQGSLPIAHEIVEANFRHALSKFVHMLRESPGFCEELLEEAQRRLSEAVHSTLGRNVSDFIQTIKSQSKTFHFIKHENRHFILLRETIHTQTNPLLSGINKVKKFITKGCNESGKFAFSELVKKCSGLTRDEVFFIGKNAQLIKSLLKSHPDQFSVQGKTVSVMPNAPSLPAGLAKYPSTCLPEWPSGPLVYQVKTPTQNSLALPAPESSPPLPASTLTSQQNGGEDVVGDHLDITSFMQSLVSSDAGEDTRHADVSNDSTSGQRGGNSTRIRPSSKSFPGECIVTIVKDPSSFKRITSEKVSQYDRPIIAVVSSDQWLVLHFWEGDVFAIDVGALSPMTTGDLSGSGGKIAGGPLENMNTWAIIGVVGDLLRDESIVKVVRGAVALSVDLQQLAGLNLTNVFDVMIADNIIRQQRRPVSIEELQELYEVTPCSEVKVIWENSKPVVSSELVDSKGRMKEGAVQQLRELVTQSSCLIPDLYQVMLSMMSADMLLKLSKRCEVAVKTKKAKDSSSQSSGKKPSTCQTLDIFSIPGTFPPSMTNSCIPGAMATGVQHHPGDGVDGFGGEEEEGMHGFPIQMSSRERVAIGQSVRSKRPLAHDGEQGSSGRVPAVGRDDHQQSPRTKAPVAEREITFTPQWMQPMILQYQGDGKPIYVHPLSELASVPINPCQVTEELEDAFWEMVKADVQTFVGAFDGMIKAALERLTEKDPQYALENLAEVVLDIGRKPLARYFTSQTRTDMVTESLDGAPVSREVLQDLMDGDTVVMTTERKAGIIGTLHRMGVMTNYLGDATGVTAKVERPILGCLNPLYDLIIEDRSILLWGPPAVGKTTLLREAARVLSDVSGKSVSVVDTYGEICGEGDVPHLSVGSARRVQVHQRELQHRDMMETLQNQRPETVVIDDIQGEEEAAAIFEMRKQGTQVIAALCACSLEEVIDDPAHWLLFGREKSAGRGMVDDNRRGVLGNVAWQRLFAPVFDTLVEMRDRNHWILHRDLASTVDAVWETDTTLCVEERRVVMGSQGGEVTGHEEVIAMTKPFKLYEP